jgi:hypothetical protein
MKTNLREMGDMFREKEAEDLILKGQRVNVKLFFC